MDRWFGELECPSCGSSDVDLATVIPGPLFKCQECQHPFDPPDEEVRRPTVQLTGVSGNVFAIIAAVRRALVADDQPERAAEWVGRAVTSGSYSDVLQLLFEFVEPE